MNEITDETLTAYLDGELSDAEAASVETAVAASPELQDRLAELDVPVGDIRAAFDQTLKLAPDSPTLPEPSPARKTPWLAMAASVLAGIGIGALAFRDSPQNWTEAVANYQSLYVSQTLSAPPMPHDQRTLVVAGLSGQLGVDLTPLIELGDIEFRRAQMLGINGAPLVQMAYLADGAVPVAICVTPIAGGDTEVETSRLYGMQAASWTEGGHGYLVIGGDDAGLIRQVAQKVRAAI